MLSGKRRFCGKTSWYVEQFNLYLSWFSSC